MGRTKNTRLRRIGPAGAGNSFAKVKAATARYLAAAGFGETEASRLSDIPGNTPEGRLCRDMVAVAEARGLVTERDLAQRGWTQSEWRKHGEGAAGLLRQHRPALAEAVA